MGMRIEENLGIKLIEFPKNEFICSFGLLSNIR